MKNRRIALLIEPSTAFGRGALRGIAAYARKNPGWELFFDPDSDGSFDHRQLAQWNPHGLLVRARDRRNANRILRTGIPAIDLGFTIPDMFPWALSNHQADVGRLAGEHLLARGFRNFAFCGWGRSDPSVKTWETPRLQSFREATKRQVSVYRGSTSTSERQWKPEQERLAAWLSKLPKPVGLLASNDRRAIQVLSACRSAGLRVPEDVGLIGVDNDEIICEASSPPLSSVVLNFAGIGMHGARLLEDLLDGKEPENQTLQFPPLGIAARQSTDVVATDDELVIRAVRLMRERMAEGIDVTELVEALPVSRKTLELRFREALDCTPLTELKRLRIERARQLLSRSDAPIKMIATECGYRHLQNFYATFSQAEGRTPADYRNETARSLGDLTLPSGDARLGGPDEPISSPWSKNPE